MLYSSFTTVPVYETDENGEVLYIEDNGERIPVETGEQTRVYAKPKPFMANIAEGGWRATETEFGANFAGYDAIIYAMREELPIKEFDLVWFHSAPAYGADGTVIADSADYVVVKVTSTLNGTKYVLKRKA